MGHDDLVDANIYAVLFFQLAAQALAEFRDASVADVFGVAGLGRPVRGVNNVRGRWKLRLARREIDDIVHADDVVHHVPDARRRH